MLLLLAALVGITGACVSLLFREAMHGIEWVLTGTSGSFVQAALDLPWWKRLLLPALGGLIAGSILLLVPRFLHGRKSSDYLEAISAGDGKIPIRSTLIRCFSSLFSISSGGSIGREGSMIQLSALAASCTGRKLLKDPSHLRLLVACGAAAGFASVYNAPLAGSLFVAEVVLGSLAMAQLGPILLSAVVADLIVHRYLGSAPLYHLPEFRLTSEWELFFYLGLGVLAGGFGPIFIRSLRGTEKLFHRLNLPLPLCLGLGGLIAGILSVYCPEVWGNGYSVTNTILVDGWILSPLLVILVCKLVATAAVSGSGAVGGVFTPTLFTGAALGSLLGQAIHLGFPLISSDPSHYAAIGMGALLAATTHAPFMAILMIFELTLRYEIILPLTLACVLSSVIARRLYPHSIYDKG
jgi:H+/Cl- antiporter ClcA